MTNHEQLVLDTRVERLRETLANRHDNESMLPQPVFIAESGVGAPITPPEFYTEGYLSDEQATNS